MSYPLSKANSISHMTNEAFDWGLTKIAQRKILPETANVRDAIVKSNDQPIRCKDISYYLKKLF